MRIGATKIHRLLLIAVLALNATVVVASDMVRVVDGDTLDIGNTRFRLHGIDAPEAGQTCMAAGGGAWPCGKEAIRKIEQMLIHGQVACEPKGRDLYGRTIAICMVEGRNINAEMVSSGFAWAFRRYSDDYVGLEGEARRGHVGVWQANTETPWDFRAKKWDAALTQTPDRKCPIKGNINRKNEKIYHTPWSRDYEKTKIDVARGERWFCSEDEAIEAGWRPPAWSR